MTVLRFTPPIVTSAFSSTTEGLYNLSSNWSLQVAPTSGDTAIVNSGTLDTVGNSVSGVSVFAISQAGSSTPALSLKSTVLGVGSTLVVDSRAVGTSIPITVSSTLENDGTIDILGRATLSASAGAAVVVNKGSVNLYNGFLVTGTVIENDGTITVNNNSLTTLTSPITGVGSIVLKPGSNVETNVNVSSGQTFKFVGDAQANSRLQIDSPVAFHSPIAGFSASDTIVIETGSSTVTNLNYVNTGANSGSLQVSTGNTTTSVNFSGSYTISDFTVSGTTGGVVIATSRTNQGIASTSPVYRFFDTNNGTHFFTSSASERDQVVNASSNFTYEGVGLNATDPNGSSAAPVYRFFDTNHGTHFYTASAAERDSVISSRTDLTFEGTGFYGDTTQQAGDTAVYRFFDTHLGTHFYTASASESASIQAGRVDLKYEGVSFYSAS